MNLLLDSHTLLWALHDPERLRPDAAKAIRDPASVVFFSAASAWELELKAALGKLSLPHTWLYAAVETGFVELPVTAEVARHSVGLPWHHKDPFDRVIVAQARAHGLQVATRDSVISLYGVPVLEV